MVVGGVVVNVVVGVLEIDGIVAVDVVVGVVGIVGVVAVEVAVGVVGILLVVVVDVAAFEIGVGVVVVVEVPSAIKKIHATLNICLHTLIKFHRYNAHFEMFLPQLKQVLGQ